MGKSEILPGDYVELHHHWCNLNNAPARGRVISFIEDHSPNFPVQITYTVELEGEQKIECKPDEFHKVESLNWGKLQQWRDRLWREKHDGQE